MDVFFLVVTDFVSEDCEDFRGSVVFEESVEKGDPFGAAKTGEKSVGFGGPFGAVHDEDAGESEFLGLGVLGD